MDYKYIEQLMERYWNAETSLEEESILRTFFSQKDIPAEMEHLRPLFIDEAVGETLDGIVHGIRLKTMPPSSRLTR